MPRAAKEWGPFRIGISHSPASLLLALLFLAAGCTRSTPSQRVADTQHVETASSPPAVSTRSSEKGSFSVAKPTAPVHSAPRSESSSAVLSRITRSTDGNAIASTSALFSDRAAFAAPRLREIPKIDDLVESAIKDEKTPGAVVVVGRRNGVVFQKAYGRRSVFPEKHPMRLDTIFDLASLTKPVVTASLVQAFADAGKLELSDRVSKYLPEIDNRRKGELTIWQLLLHVSGLPVSNSLNDYRDGPDAALEKIYNCYLQALPNREFLYSDVGYIILGELLERVGGKPLDELAKELLLEPLGMDESGYRPDPGLLHRIAPTEHDYNRPVPLIHGDVHDPRAYRLGGVAGHSGLFSTAHDMARFARMLLGEGKLEGTRVLSAAAVQTLTRPQAVPGGTRTLGFDHISKYSRARGEHLSPRAYGHGGYTGTSLWVDPAQDLFVLFLSNRVHPFGHGKVLTLQGEIADAAVKAIAKRPRACESPKAVLPGVDHLAARNFDSLKDRNVGLVTHRAAVTREGQPTWKVLRDAPGVNLAAVFSPEHGLSATREGSVGDSRLGKIPVYSLYGKTKRPTPRMLRGVDTLVVDLVDVGVRFYTYLSTLHETLRAAAEQGLDVVVLDRPNPQGGLRVAGPILEESLQDFVNHHPLPILHGLTLGEAAELIVNDERLPVRLEVIRAADWTRQRLITDLDLPWVAPSPNLRNPQAVLLYPAVGLLESTNISVGRGTSRPFHWFGAPFIDPQRLMAELKEAELGGVRFTPGDETPNAYPYRGKVCHGVGVEITDVEAFDPMRTGFALATALARVHPKQWDTRRFKRMVGSSKVAERLARGDSPERVLLGLQEPLEDFRQRAEPFLKYPSCPPDAPQSFSMHTVPSRPIGHR